jgi:hypothetical protein
MQVIGIFAVVASLIFVGLQMKQSQEIALAEQYQARAEAAQAMYLSVLESGVSWESLDVPMQEKSPDERNLVITLSQWSWTQYDNHYFQYKAGFLDEESWAGLSARISEIYSDCEEREYWDYMRSFFRPSFVEYVEALDGPCKASR